MVGVFLAVGTSLLANATKGACRWRSPSGLWLSRLTPGARGGTSWCPLSC